MSGLLGARMKAVVMCSAVTIHGRDYLINTNASKRQGCYVEILHAIDRNIVAMLSYHSRVFVVQFVVHLFDPEPLNTGISKLMKVFKKRLAHRYSLSRVCGGWVRETGKSGVPHYHVALFLDGNHVRSHFRLQELIAEILDARNYPRASFVTSHMIARGDIESLANAFYHLSYLAKTRDKGNRPPSTNDYSFGRPKPKPLVGQSSEHCKKLRSETSCSTAIENTVITTTPGDTEHVHLSRQRSLPENPEP